MTWPRIWSSSTKDEQEADAASFIKDVERTVEAALERVKETAKVESTTASKSKRSSYLSVFTEPPTLIAAVILTAASLGGFKVYRTFLRRFPEATNIDPNVFRRKSIFGKVTSVGDGDNFRIYHTPGGWPAGWGWLPWRRVPTDKKDLRNQTIHLRLAGIDAPELAHFGRPAQPHSQEALDWLTSYVLGRRVRAYVYKNDQYSRAVGTAYVWKGFLRRDVGLQMIQAGLATVYEAKSGAEFGEGLEDKYRQAESWAKTRKKGMWAGKASEFESPREYKNKYGAGNAPEQHPAPVSNSQTPKKPWWKLGLF